MTTDGAAEALRRHREAQRRGVVERRRGEVHRSSPSTPNSISTRPVSGVVVPSGAARERRLHALGPSRRARRVEHVVALDAVGEGLGRGAGDAWLRTARSRRRCRRASAAVARAGSTISAACSALYADVMKTWAPQSFDDVRELGGREARASRRVVRGPRSARPTRSRGSEGGSPCRARRGRLGAGRGRRRAATPVGGVVELAVGHHRARAAHDDGRLVGVGRRVRAGEHGIAKVPRVRCAPMQPSAALRGLGGSRPTAPFRSTRPPSLHRRARRIPASTSPRSSPASTTSPARCRRRSRSTGCSRTCSAASGFRRQRRDYYDPRNSLLDRRARPPQRHPDHAVGRARWRSAAGSACRSTGVGAARPLPRAGQGRAGVFVDPFHGGRCDAGR